MSDLPNDARELCAICVDMVRDDSEVPEDVIARLHECETIEQRAVECHDRRGLVCPFAADEGLCEDGPRAGPYRALKRALDIAGGLIGSAVLVLIMPLVALVVRLQSPGPIFFIQDRVGRNGDTFRLFKFRTMHQENDGEARWANEETDRIFSFGAFMRRYHIDEFPQFFNVLRGDMSLVGPRPEQVPIVARLGEKIPNYDKRHCVLPGITGWAQMRHGYAGCELTSWLKTASDLYYIKHRSLGLDLSILLRTVPAVLSNEQVHRDEAGAEHGAHVRNP